MIQANIDLSGLRDLHFSVKPPVFPLAYGWWVLLVILLVCVLMSVVVYRLWQLRPAVYAKHELMKIVKIADDKSFLKELSVLLRRVAMKSFGRQAIAPLSDEKWQAFLMKAVPNVLKEEEAYLIALSPYETKLKKSLNRGRLVQQTQLWINKVLKQKKSLDIGQKK